MKKKIINILLIVSLVAILYPIINSAYYLLAYVKVFSRYEDNDSLMRIIQFSMSLLSLISPLIINIYMLVKINKNHKTAIE